MPVWPSSLPQAPLAESFRETVADNTLRTQMDQGPAKLRRRSTSAVGTIGGTFLLTRPETATLIEFYETALSGGVIPFSFYHPRHGAQVSCRFKTPPTLAATSGGFIRASVEFEVMP